MRIAISNGDGSFTGTNIENIFTGDDGNNNLAGGNGNDILTGNAGNDTVSGGNGNDTLIGGIGNDTADYSAIGQAITLKPKGVVTKGTAGTDQLVGIENIIGAKGLTNIINASTATGTATINANLATKSLVVNTGDSAFPTLSFSVHNFVNVIGTANNDTITGNDGNNNLAGGNGNDILTGNGGNDIVSGGNGNDTLIGGLAADRFVFNSQFQGIDIIKDFQRTQSDKIQVSQSGFGATSLDQFSYNALSGNLSFLGSTFAVIENKPAGFAVNLDVVLV